MSDGYFLRGVINIFDNIPAFVIPVFKSITDKVSYVQYIDNDKIVLDAFSHFSDSIYLSKVKFYGIFNSGYNFIALDKKNQIKSYRKTDTIRFSDLSEPIFAFQTDSNIFYGKTNSFISFLNDFETEDEYLKEEIDDFKKNNVKFKNSGVGNNISIEDEKYEVIELNLLDAIHQEHTIDIVEVRGCSDIFENESNPPFVISANEFPKFPHFLVSCKESNERKTLLKKLDQQLRNTQCSSDEYKKLIASIYELLFDTQNYVYGNIYNHLKFNNFSDTNK